MDYGLTIDTNAGRPQTIGGGGGTTYNYLHYDPGSPDEPPPLRTGGLKIANRTSGDSDGEDWSAAAMRDLRLDR